MYTLQDLMEHIKANVEEVTLLELLNLKSEDLVDAFQDRIEERFDYLVKELMSDNPNDDDSDD